MTNSPYTSADFHNEVHKQLVTTATATLSDTKLVWSQIMPFLEAGRAVCRDDVLLNGRFTLHGLEQQGEQLVAADEAYLSISVRDREDGAEWLSHSYWLSDIVLSDPDPERVRAAMAGMERTLARLKTWLAEQEAARAKAPDMPAAAAPASEDPA